MQENETKIKFCRVCKCELVLNINHKLSLAKCKNWICNSCKADYDKKLLDKNPFRNHASAIKRYGINAEDYEKMYYRQNGKCKICGEKAPLHSNDRKRLYVDHCHKTNEVRGLLCKNCNSGLGQFRENTTVMKKAVLYLGDKKFINDHWLVIVLAVIANITLVVNVIHKW